MTSSATEDKQALEIIPTLGGSPQVLATGLFPYQTNTPSGPSISPDGREVAYLEWEPKLKSKLMVVPADGGQSRNVRSWDEIKLASFFVPVIKWTPDSRFLLCVGSKRANADNLDDWEWFALPVDGGKPVATDAGVLLRKAGFRITVPSTVMRDRVLFSGPELERGHVWEVSLSAGPWRLNGPPRQLTFGTESEDAKSASEAGIAAIQTSKSYSDLYLLPTDSVTGQTFGTTRRLTHDTRFKGLQDGFPQGTGGDPRLAYFNILTSGVKLTGYSLDLESGNQSRLTTPFDFGATWTVSRDGRQIAYALPEGDLLSIRIGDAGTPVDSARVLCRGCGRAGAFSPDGGHFLLYEAGRMAKNKPGRKSSISLLDVAAAQEKPWLDHPRDSLEVKQLTGEEGKWVVVSAQTPGSSADSSRTFLVPWREEPVPLSEWVEVPARNAKFSAAGNLIYFFKDSNLLAMKFDPRTKRIGQPFQVKLMPGSQPVLKLDDEWSVRGPGIVFKRAETKSSVWLMKVPE